MMSRRMMPAAALPMMAGLVLSFGVAVLATAKEPAGKKTRLGKPTRVLDSESLRGPEVADLDGDGRLDLVSGTYAGTIQFAKRQGGSQSLNFAPEVPLRSGTEAVQLKHW